MSAARPRLPQEFVVAHRRRRMIDAMAELCAEHGYAATRIAAVVERARVARKSLYDNFAGKEGLLLAAFDATVGDLEAVVVEACDAVAADDWNVRAEAGLRALLDYVAAHPEATKLCLVEAPVATAASAERYEAAFESCVARLCEVAPPGPDRSGVLEEALVGGTVWIVQRQVRRGEGDRASELLPQLAEFVVSPYRDVGKR
ncbi:MAG TPA: helix-turn-helix domain-containing protein [Solirubrobacterales bacterium]|nr:helix-turn-helix domain-containing protein [Solirubrobacterales bacterium]